MIQGLSRLIAGVAVAVTTVAAAAQTPPRIAVTSLVGNTMVISYPRDQVGTNVARNHQNSLPVAGPALDHAALEAAQVALRRAVPGGQVTLLRVPAAGTSADPVNFFDDGLVDMRNPVLKALREQGFTHVLAMIKLRDTNRVRLKTETIGHGQLEGVGFYVDPRIEVRFENSPASYQGIVAPHVYIQLVLIDLQAGQVRGIEKIRESDTVSAARSKNGDDPWNSLSAEEKVTALESMIRGAVPEAVWRLYPAR